MQILLKEKEVFAEKTHLLQDWFRTQTGHQYGFRDVMWHSSIDQKNPSFPWRCYNRSDVAVSLHAQQVACGITLRAFSKKGERDGVYQFSWPFKNVVLINSIVAYRKKKSESQVLLITDKAAFENYLFDEQAPFGTVALTPSQYIS